ncbi:uncharacterized protein HD556DRAFT_1233108, partial [Suillus plorans]
DKYSDLEDILQRWCLASGAKFNMEKTEILPIGMKDHHAAVVQDRKLNALDVPWSEQVMVAQDGNPIRTLGAWIGNEIEYLASWKLILSKIEKHLARWNTCHSTLNGKHLIVQMVIGGMSQFLTKAQEMPKMIEKVIMKLIKDFISPIGLGRPEQPTWKGGINLLNISTQNKAIEITWLRVYMNMSKSQPAWAFVMDSIINVLNPNGITDSADI